MTNPTALSKYAPSVQVEYSEFERRDKAARVLVALRETYGSHKPRRRLSATDSLIATILSQHTADRNSNAAFVQLRKRYRTWEEIVCCDLNELASTIRPAGLANIKAARIQAALSAVENKYGTYDLSFLEGMPLQEGKSALQALPGVGPKTAACVLLFACGQPALPVDTHVHRVARRLGLIGVTETAERAHDVLEAVIPAVDVYDFHVDLITHGRKICRARDPQCAVCPLQRECDYYRSVV